MPRVARSIVSDIPYHVIHRGNNRQLIFFSGNDYSYFLSLMKEAKEKYCCKIYSYALMPNHVHVLLEPLHCPSMLANFIKLIAQKYAQYINCFHSRTGTLWEGRFRSSPVSKDNYLLTCSRYIELNPVRAKIVEDPKNYLWSSYRIKMGEKDKYLLLDRDPLYLGLGSNEVDRQTNYREWINDSIPTDEWNYIRRAINKGGIWGNNQFKEKLENTTGRKLDIRDQGRPKRNSKE